MSRSTRLLQAVVAAAVLLGTARAQEPEEVDNGALAQALCDAQDRGELTVKAAVAAMASKNHFVASTAASIIRHEWQELPEELFSALHEFPLAARHFLEQLVIAPRPQAAAWVATQTTASGKRSLDHRLMALAARGKPLTKDEALLLLEAAKKNDVGDGFYYAASNVSEKIAGRLIGAIHQGLSQETLAVNQLGPLLDRLSLRGTKSLLGLAVTLPEAVAHRLLRHVYESQPELVQSRVASALDGKIPLDSQWLDFARGLLTSEERVERVVKMLLESDSGEDRARAFDLLLSEDKLDQRSLEATRDTGTERDLRRLIGRAVNQLPSSFVIDCLEGSPQVSEEMARALTARTVLEPELQKQLLDMLDGFGAADNHTPLYAVTALVRKGNAEALKTIWPLVMGSTAWRDLLYRLGQREEPFAYEMMLAEITAAKKSMAGLSEEEQDLHQQKLDMLRLLLVGRGDRRELDTLVANAPKRRAIFVRRCRHYADKLSVKHQNALFDAALRCEDPEIGSELLEWAATPPEDGEQPAAIADRLWQLWNDPPEIDMVEILQDTAMRLLASGPKRAALLAELRAASKKGPLPEPLKSLPFELLNTMAQPMAEDDVSLCAELLLKLPLADPKGEQRRVRRWPNGTSGFPLVAAIANRLRGADLGVADQVFEGMVEELAGDPRCANISRQRLKVFWRALAFETDLQLLLGRITSQLWIFHDGDDEVGDAAGMWFQAQLHEHNGDFARAEQLYRAVGRELWRLPSMRGEARWLLGERNPGAGQDPLAALAAAPYRMRLLAALKADDQDAIREASTLLREFAGHDRYSLATLNETPLESGR